MQGVSDRYVRRRLAALVGAAVLAVLGALAALLGSSVFVGRGEAEYGPARYPEEYPWGRF